MAFVKREFPDQRSECILADAIHFIVVLVSCIRSILAVPLCAIAGRVSLRAAAVLCFVRCLERLGPAYVKIGQLLATRVHELPAFTVDSLKRLQDRTAPFDIHASLSRVEASLGRRVVDVFEFIDPQPVASGSIAQVHHGRLRNGTTVAVKVKRPRALLETRRALSLMRRGLHLLVWAGLFRGVPAEEAFEELARAVLQQCDFRREREMNKRLREVCAGMPNVFVPKIFEDVSCEEAIVMEFVDGLERVEKLARRVDVTESIRIGFRAIFRMTLSEGLIHCDLHPGNVYFKEDGDVVILDTGLVEEMADSEVFDFREFFLGVVLGDGRRCAEVLISTASSIKSTFEEEHFVSEIASLIRRVSRKSAGEFRVLPFATELFSIQRRFGVRGSHRFTLAILSFIAYEGIACEFAPDMDFQLEAMPILGPTLVRRSFFAV